MGFCDLVEVTEIGETNVIVFRQGERERGEGLGIIVVIQV